MFLGGNQRVASLLAMAPVAGAFVQLAALLTTSNACVRFGGMSASLLPANVGVTAYVGAIS